MLLENVLMKKNEIMHIVESNKGTNIKVFGSTVSGKASVNSDVDFLVNLKDDASLFDLIEMKIELEELLGSSVDVISENGLKDNEIGLDIKRSAISI